MVNIRFEVFDCIIIIMAFVFVFILPVAPIGKSEYVPNVVTGLTTMSGILTALIGYWLAHLLSDITEENKEWMKKRISAIIVFVLFSLMIVIYGLSQIVYGNLEFAYTASLKGTMVITLILLDVMLMIVVKNVSKTGIA